MKKPPKKPTKPALKNLGRVGWESPTMSATLVIGAKQGKDTENRTGFCVTAPGKRTPEDIENTVKYLRQSQLAARYPTKSFAAIEKMYSATSVRGKGWFEGADEDSVSLTFYHESANKKPTPQELRDFQGLMRRLTEQTASVLCQDSVLLTFDTPIKRGTESHTTTGEGATARDRGVRTLAQEEYLRRPR